jgi:hypothetical protein
MLLSPAIAPAGEYTFGIEGPAVDARGNLYVVNSGKPGTIGKLAAGASQSELFAVLPEGSIGNAILCRGVRDQAQRKGTDRPRLWRQGRKDRLCVAAAGRIR